MLKHKVKKGTSSKTTVQKKELVDMLKALKPGLAKGNAEVTKHKIVFAGEAAFTYNETVGIQYPIETPFQCTVVGEDLYKVVSTIKSKEVALSEEDGVLKIRSSDTKADLLTDEPTVEFITMIQNLKHDEVVDRMKQVPDNFQKGLDMTRFSTNKVDTSTNTHCVYINENIMLGTDNHRVTMYELDESVTDEEILIPHTSLKDLDSYTILEFTLHNGWAHFLCEGGAVYSVSTLQGDYPDMMPALEEINDMEGEEVELPKALSKAIKDCCVLIDTMDRDRQELNVEVKSDEIILTAKDKNRGSVTKVVKVDYDKEELSFAIHPYCLSEVLEHVSTFEVNDTFAIFRAENFLQGVTVAIDPDEED